MHRGSPPARNGPEPKRGRSANERVRSLPLGNRAFTTTTGKAHWELLLRARAVENLAYVAAPAQGGVHENGRRTWGHSMQVDPWGEILCQRAEGDGVDIADLDVERVRQVRLQLPALEHRVL